ncbi:CPBP family intramembrane metalloprotease [bacterium]|nr:CPBP family intramembrane metalloprotease [bacterium]
MVRRVMLLGLLPLWLSLQSLRWKRALAPQEAGFDPTPVWLERLSHLHPIWFCLVGFLFVGGLGLAARLRWPVPRPAAVPLDKAALAYLAAQSLAVLVMAPLARTSPLIQQLVYAVWMVISLWPWRHQLGLQWKPGWPGWVGAGYVLAMGGALLYGWLIHPPPSSNAAVPLLLKAGWWERCLWWVQICLITPVIEESWYRSLLSGPARGRLLFSALLFAAVHADPSGFPQLVWLGLVFGWVRWGAGLPAAVATHALWNLSVFVYLLWT